ncbi:hypothetical protein ACWFR1_32725 [Streptomyces sp. NPDC055103]
MLASGLSMHEWELYQLTDDRTRLDRSVARAESALDALPDDAPDLAGICDGLGR